MQSMTKQGGFWYQRDVPEGSANHFIQPMRWVGFTVCLLVVAAPANAQGVVPSDSLRFRSGAELRVQLGFRDRIEGRFFDWVGDTLTMPDRMGGRVAVPWDDVQRLSERRREPLRAVVLGAVGGGAMNVGIYSLGSGLCTLTGNCPTVPTQFVRGAALGAALSLIADTLFPQYRTRYDRRRSTW